MKHVFGPVPSRRLGFSLGVDLVVPKTCTLDCIYCELGPTTDRTVRRASYVDVEGVLEEVRRRLGEQPKVDFVTISGSGEPTLNVDLARFISGIRDMTTTPIAVLTNGTLMTDPDVRRALMGADVVVPSMDAVSPEVFRAINRPDPSLDPSEIITALEQFSSEFDGEIWLEIVFVRGLNDTPEEIALMKEAVQRIRPTKVQLNTVVRPPACADSYPVERERLLEIAAELGDRAEVIAPPRVEGQRRTDDAEAVILAMGARRPVTVTDVANAVGLSRAEAAKVLGSLLDKGAITVVRHGEKLYYRA